MAHICNICKDTGVVKDKTTNKYRLCKCCSREKFLKAFEKSISRYRHNDDDETADGLQAVLDNLPEYPVVALMEARDRQLGQTIIDILETEFAVLPLG